MDHRAAQEALAEALREQERRMVLREQLPREWRPRPYQQAFWGYMLGGGKRAVIIAHRRWGKDDIALNWTCRAMHQRVGPYWHMLPQAAQARKVIWDAVNPLTLRRRIDDAFPGDLRANTRETDMFIRMTNGSTWQVVGSDNYNSLVGAPPVGIVFSEWALADPHAWSYLRPILEENNGWAIFITTPRGRNHAHRSLMLANAYDDWYGEVSPATETGVFTAEELARIKDEMALEWGPDDAESLFAQEYLCSFDAPLVGAFYSKMIHQAEAEGRVTNEVEAVPGIPVETAWDLGYEDDTAIWWFQVVGDRVLILDYYSSHGHDVPHYCDVIQRRAKLHGWDYKDQMSQNHWVPWDAAPKTLASPRSILQQAWEHGVKMRLTPNLSRQDGIQAVRRILPRCWFHKDRCADGIECLRQYQREWDPERKVFRKTPLHNWASHGADAFRMLGVAMRERVTEPEPRVEELRGMDAVTMERLWEDRAKMERRLH